MPSVKLGKSVFEYGLRVGRSEKTVGIALDPEDGLLVTAPEGLGLEEIEKILLKRAPWIIEKQEHLARIAKRPQPLEFLSGEKLAYLGRRYRLKVRKDGFGDHARARFRDGMFQVSVPPGLEEGRRRELVRSALKTWHLDKARQRIPERVRLHAPKVGVEPRDILIRNQVKRWGSCTSSGKLLYNWKIIMAPMSVVDYVVVHELCHLREPYHNNKFWRLLGSVIPNYDQRKDWLLVNGPTLTF
ncbi:MAG: M48 family metallopeptidase [Proteobacteria bacterium]|nr:M48 family metallopeptidase [Pseudomonadota bacterium]